LYFESWLSKSCATYVSPNPIILSLFIAAD
jgi:hypothetical protein